MTTQTTKGYVPSRTADLSNLPRIKGYDFEKDFNIKEFLKSYSTTGIQASNLAMAIEAINAMRREKATVFLSYTSNMVSCGVRETIRYMVKNRKVDVLVTAAGGIEETG